MTKKIVKNILFIVSLASVHAHAQQVNKAVAEAINASLYFPTVQNNEGNYIIINSTRTDKPLSDKEFNDIFDNLYSINLYRQVLSKKIDEADFNKVSTSVIGKVTSEKIKKTLTKDEIAYWAAMGIDETR